MRGWGHGKTKQVFPRGSGTGGSDGPGSSADVKSCLACPHYLTDWKDVDPDIPELIEAKKRMAALGEVEAAPSAAR